MPGAAIRNPTRRRVMPTVRMACMSYQVEEFLETAFKALRRENLSRAVLETMEYDEDQDNDIKELLHQAAYGRTGKGKPLGGLLASFENRGELLSEGTRLHDEFMHPENLMLAVSGIYNTALFQQLQTGGVPVINFSTGTGGYLSAVAACGGDVIGVDWHTPLDVAWAAVGDQRAVQGNLDPIALLAPWRELQPRIDDVLARAGGKVGHIFNLGHGILQNTPIESVQRMVDYVHEKTAL